MIFEFLTPVGRLRIPDSVPDHQLLQNKDWPLDENQNRVNTVLSYLSTVKIITGMETK